ncbi:helix-turn-helix domain-containing protein [Bacillus sp. JJ664]
MNKLTILEEVVLFLVNRYNGERTIQGITYLLKGKQSAQIIQDSHFYQVTNFFGLYQFLTQQDMQDLIKGLREKGYLEKIEGNNIYRVSHRGSKYLQNVKCQFHEFQYINGLRFASVQKIFWRRLSLFFQTISNINHNIKYFRAVQQENDVQDWVKYELLNAKGNKKDLVIHFHTELHHILKQLQFDDASIIVKRLTGANTYGMTLEQIATRANKSEELIYIHSVNAMHHMLTILTEQTAEYPLLSRFLKGSISSNITNTSIETKRLFQAGKTIIEIATIRHLKISTIEDHIVECVLSDDLMSIDQFISNEEYNKVKRKIEELQTRKLKDIKEALLNEVTYFQIRITLARMGDLKWN